MSGRGFFGHAREEFEASEDARERDMLENSICNCGAGHGSLEGHTEWCAWTKATTGAPKVSLPHYYVWERTGTSKYGALMEPEGSIIVTCCTIEKAHEHVCIFGPKRKRSKPRNRP